ncbi:peptidoglycan-binding protein [Streptomyces sp. NPDC101152]|uniref:peptidoglycan-binding protein n=1 Tax=Streptomyces sp. NPDC101152 TaxID=3366116 RepID=UPI0037FD6BD9
MGRWRALPAELEPAVAKLVSQLRELKDTSGRTTLELAKETGYSTSSWERYFSGRAFPPREAVEALAKVVDADVVRLLAVHQMAQDASRRRAEAVGVEPPPRLDEPVDGLPAAGGTDSAGERRRSRTWQTLLAAGAGAVVGAVTTALVMAPSAGAARPAAGVGRRVVYTCVYTLRDGLWYAGNSTTRTQQLVVDMTGSDVAELQCLLQRVDITPGGIDGSFGPLTEAAVIRAQKKYHLDVDGQVGPRTWAALRR